MAQRTLQQIREDGHQPQAGYSPFNRPLYGNNVNCQCGWEFRGPASFTKRQAEQEHHDHLRQADSA